MSAFWTESTTGWQISIVTASTAASTGTCWPTADNFAYHDEHGIHFLNRAECRRATFRPRAKSPAFTPPAPRVVGREWTQSKQGPPKWIAERGNR